MRSALLFALLACMAVAAAVGQPVDLYGHPVAPVLRPTATSPLPEPPRIQMQAAAQGAMQPVGMPAAMPTQPVALAPGSAATAAAPTVVPQGSMVGPDGKVYQLDAQGFPVIPLPRNHITAAVIADMAKDQELAEKAKAMSKPQDGVAAAPAAPKLTAVEEALIARLTGSLAPIQAEPVRGASLLEVSTQFRQPSSGLSPAELAQEALDKAAEAAEKAAAERDLAEQKADEEAAKRDREIMLATFVPDSPPPAPTPAPTPAPPAPTVPTLVKPVIDEKIVPLPDEPETKKNTTLDHLPPCPANSTAVSLMEVDSESGSEAEAEVEAEAETESEQAPADGLTEAERRQEALDKAADAADKAAEAKDLAEQKADQIAAQKDLIVLQSSTAPDSPPPPPAPTPVPVPPPATPAPAPPAPTGPKLVKPVIDEKVVPLPEPVEKPKDTTLAHLPPCDKPAVPAAAPVIASVPAAAVQQTIAPVLVPARSVVAAPAAAPAAPQIVYVRPVIEAESASTPAVAPAAPTTTTVTATATTVVFDFQSLLETAAEPKLVKPVIDEKVVPLPELPEPKKDADLAKLQPCPANSTVDASLLEVDADQPPADGLTDAERREEAADRAADAKDKAEAVADKIAAGPKLVKPVIDEKVVPLPELPEVKKDTKLEHLQPCPAEKEPAKAALVEVDSESEAEAETEVDAEAETEAETEAEAESESEQAPADGLTEAERRQEALDKAADAADKAAEAKDLAEQKSDAAKAAEDAKVLAASMAPDVPPAATPVTPAPAPPTPPIPATPAAPAAPAGPKLVRPVIQDGVVGAPEPVAPPSPTPCPKRRFRAAKQAKKVPVDVVVQVPTVEYVPVDVVHFVPQPDVIEHAYYVSHPQVAQPIMMEMQAQARSQAELEADADAQAEIAAQVAAELDAEVEAKAQTEGEGEGEAEVEAEAETEGETETEGAAEAEGEAAAEGEAEGESEVEADAESDGAITADSDPKLIFSRRRHVRRAAPEPDRGLAPEEHPVAKHFVDAQAWEQKTTIGNDGGIMHGYHDPKLPAKAWAFWKGD